MSRPADCGCECHENAALRADVAALEKKADARLKQRDKAEAERDDWRDGFNKVEAERDALQQRLDDSRSLQEGTATLLGVAIAESDKAEAERDALARIVEEQREWVRMILSWKPRDIEPTISALEQMDIKLAKARAKEPASNNQPTPNAL